MKYLVLLARSDAHWEGLSDAQRNYSRIDRWWQDLGRTGQLLEGAELQPARTATTIRWQEDKPVITDGPFIEAKETIGGYGVIDVPDLEAALKIAGSWPAQDHSVEVRPIVSR